MRKFLVVSAIALLVALSFGCQAPEQSDTQAPDEVTELTATGGDGEITLNWKEPGNTDYSGLEILGDNELPRVYIARGITITKIPDCKNDVLYTLSVRTIDTSKNKSDGVTVTATPKAAPPATFTVDFDVDGGSAVARLTNVAGGSLITAPTAPTKTGYRFKNWYKSDLTTVWDFGADKVYSDMTLYARWNSAPEPVIHTAALPTLANLEGTWCRVTYSDTRSKEKVVIGKSKLSFTKTVKSDGSFFELTVIEDTYFDPNLDPDTVYLAEKGSYTDLGDGRLRETTTGTASSVDIITEANAKWRDIKDVDEGNFAIFDGCYLAPVFTRSGTGDSLIDSWLEDSNGLDNEGKLSYMKVAMTFSDTSLKQSVWQSKDGTYSIAPQGIFEALYTDNGDESITVSKTPFFFSGPTFYYFLSADYICVNDQPIADSSYKKL